MLLQPFAVLADSIPYPADNTYGFYINATGAYLRKNFLPTRHDACRLGMTDLHGVPLRDNIYSHFTYVNGLWKGECWYNTIDGGVRSGYPDEGWNRDSMCPFGGRANQFINGMFEWEKDVPMCSCPPGQDFGPTPGRPCVPASDCPVREMKPLPTDACSMSLEANNGLADPAVCPAIPVMTDKNGEPCLSKKLADLGIPYAGPTSTIRTPAYQAHLKDVWDKYWEHQWLITDPVVYQACTAKRAIIENEQNKHGIVYPPVGTSHNDGKAFDVSQTVIAAIGKARIPRLLNSPTACTLGWGGSYTQSPPDPVHFFLNVP